MSPSINKTRRLRKPTQPKTLPPFETNKVFKEINNQIQKELLMRQGFSVQKVPLTRWEKSQMITASEFLQI
jgi:hypothetical protein